MQVFTIHLNVFQTSAFESANLSVVHHQEDFGNVHPLYDIRSCSVVDVVYIKGVTHMIYYPLLLLRCYVNGLEK